MYPNEKPNPEYINQSPPLLEATTTSFAKKADATIQENDDEHFMDAVEELVKEDSKHDAIQPEIKMTDYNYDPDDYTVTSDGLVRY